MSQVADQAQPVPDSRSEATKTRTKYHQRRRARNTQAKKDGDVPRNTADTIGKHLVHARAQCLFLNAYHRPVVREYPWTAARLEVRVRRCAEYGACDTRDRRQRDAGEHQLEREPEDGGVFSQAGRVSVKGQRGREGCMIYTCEPWVDRGDADVVCCYDWVQSAHQA
jgi:hypothetical protein